VIRRLLTAWLLAAAALVATHASQATAAANIERVRSRGGIEAWLVREPSLPLLAINFSFLGGASQDPEQKPGVGYLVAALLDEGAGELDAKAFQQRIEDHAVQLRFSVTRDYFQGSIRLLRERMKPSLDLLRLALSRPRFEADAIERIRAQVLSGLKRETTNPGRLAERTWWRAAFDGHPYGRPTNGTLESVPAIGVEDLRGYARRVLTRASLKIAAVGDIDAATLGDMLDRTFGALPESGDLQPVPDRTMGGAGARIVVPLAVPQSVVQMGGVGVARSDPDFIAAYIVNHILGGGSFTSRLYSEVREKRGLAYGVFSYLLSLRHSALFLASTQASAERTAEAIELMQSEIRRMVEHGPTTEELAKAKAYLKGSYALNFDTSTKIASMLLQIQLDELGIDYIDRRNGLIDAVTAADARRAAGRLAKGGLLVTVVGQPKGLTAKPSGD
jgi:zinc protease